MTHTQNPWFEDHVQAERAYMPHGLARTLVAMEHRLGPEPTECPHCPGTTYWKATIGAMKCPGCGNLAHANGEPYPPRHSTQTTRSPR